MCEIREGKEFSIHGPDNHYGVWEFGCLERGLVEIRAHKEKPTIEGISVTNSTNPTNEFYAEFNEDGSCKKSKYMAHLSDSAGYGSRIYIAISDFNDNGITEEYYCNADIFKKNFRKYETKYDKTVPYFPCESNDHCYNDLKIAFPELLKPVENMQENNLMLFLEKNLRNLFPKESKQYITFKKSCKKHLLFIAYNQISILTLSKHPLIHHHYM